MKTNNSKKILIISKNINNKKKKTKKLSIKKKKDFIKNENQKNNKYIKNNIENLKEIFEKSDNILQDLNNYLLKLENSNLYNYYKKNYKLFSKEKMGKSGALLGFIDDNKVIKFNEINKNSKIINYQKYIDSNNCIYLKYNFNELVLNLIISNLKYFIKKKNELKKLNLLNPYILKIKNFGIKENNTFFITNKIGILHQDSFYTNLNEIFMNNYIPILLNHIKEGDSKTIDNFNHFLSDVLADYFMILKFLNKNIGFMHTDCKTLNIFVNKNNKYNKKHKDLKKNGFVINYIPLISDLDKSILSLSNKLRPSSKKSKMSTRWKTSKMSKSNKNKSNLVILPYDDQPYKTNTSKLFGFDFIYHTRYLCGLNRDEVCKIFKSYHYDRLTVIFELYIIIYKYLEIPSKNNNCYSLFHVFNRNVSKFLEINDHQTELIYKTIKKSMLIRNTENLSLSFHINKVIGNYCRIIK